MRDSELTKLLGWPGYRVYRHEINEKAKSLKLWIRRKRGNRKLVCSGCGRKLEAAHDVSEREVRDLPCMEFRTTVVVEVYRVCCPECGIKIAGYDDIKVGLTNTLQRQFLSNTRTEGFMNSSIGVPMTIPPVMDDVAALGRRG